MFHRALETRWIVREWHILHVCMRIRPQMYLSCHLCKQLTFRNIYTSAMIVSSFTWQEIWWTFARKLLKNLVFKNLCLSDVLDICGHKATGEQNAVAIKKVLITVFFLLYPPSLPPFHFPPLDGERWDRGGILPAHRQHRPPGGGERNCTLIAAFSFFSTSTLPFNVRLWSVLSDSECRKFSFDVTLSAFPFLFQDMENKIRSTLNEIYFGKTKDIVNGLRYDPLSGQTVNKTLHKKVSCDMSFMWKHPKGSLYNCPGTWSQLFHHAFILFFLYLQVLNTM